MSVFKLTVLLMIAAVTASQFVAAAGHRDRDRERAHSNHDYSLERAVKRARSDYNGRVISAETDNGNGHGSHKIRILTDDGRVRRLRVDPETGEYIRPKRR